LRFSHEQNGAALAELYHAVAGGAPATTPGASAIATPIRGAAARVWRRVDRTIARRRAQRLRRRPAAVAAALAGARSVLVVCHGNIIRSPFAARLLDQALGDRRPVSIASAGLDALPGRPSHPLAIETAAPLRIDLRDHAASRLTRDSVASADAIFVMDVDQLLTVQRIHPGAAARTFLLTCLAPDTPLEVHDPVDGDAPIFRSCYEHMARAVPPLARVLAADAQ